MLVELTKMEQRHQAVLGVQVDGLSVTQVAEKWGASRQTVHAWLRRAAVSGAAPAHVQCLCGSPSPRPRTRLHDRPDPGGLRPDDGRVACVPAARRTDRAPRPCRRTRRRGPRRRGVTTLVLDASASVELLLDTTAGRRLSDQTAADADWWVPEHDFVEVAAATRRAGTPCRCSCGSNRPGVPAALGRALASCLQVRPLLVDAWSMRANVTVADAVYVVLADRLGASLVTADLSLVHAPGVTVVMIYRRPVVMPLFSSVQRPRAAASRRVQGRGV